ncbi:MAG: hypothetical protein RBS25_06385, partial [Bacilli bacterium]|nr:hypothetical protein [Bacilli bacterium]
MRRLKAILFIIVALCSFLIIGSLVEAAPSTVSVTVKSYFDEENIVTQTATGKAFGTKFAFDSNL